jgi:hypothetical protein
VAEEEDLEDVEEVSVVVGRLVVAEVEEADLPAAGMANKMM